MTSIKPADIKIVFIRYMFLFSIRCYFLFIQLALYL